MTPTAHLASATLFTVVSILGIGSATAGDAKPAPDPKLCAEYLRDLKTYHRMAEQLGCQMPQVRAEDARTDPNGFPPVVTEQPTTDSSRFPPVEGQDIPEQSSGAAQPSFPPVEESSTPAPKDMPPVESESSSSHKSSSSSGSGSTSSSRKKRKHVSEDPDIAAERHRHHRLHHEAKRAIRRLLREHGGFISNFTGSRD
jgi:hypothetical protein